MRTQVLLVDAMGQLLDCYAAADVAFVGGSLVRGRRPQSAGAGGAGAPDAHRARATPMPAKSCEALLAARRRARGAAMAPSWGTPWRSCWRDADARQRLGAQALQVVAPVAAPARGCMALLRAAEPTAAARRADRPEARSATC